MRTIAPIFARLFAVKGLNLARRQLVEDGKVDVVLLHANGDGVKVLVEDGRAPGTGFELLHEGHGLLLDKRVVEGQLGTAESVELGGKGETGRVGEDGLSGLETQTDDQDARTLVCGGAGGAAAVELLGQSGWAGAHQLGGALEDGEVGGVGEEVVGVDWDAVSADTETRAEGRESIRLGGCGVDHLVGVDAVRAGCVSHLVHICDVDHAVAVFEELGHFGDFWLADGNDLIEDLGVKARDNLEGLGRKGREDLGDLLGGREGAAWVDALRGHAAVEDVLVRTKDLASGTDRDGRLNDDGVAGLNVLEDHSEGVDEMAEVDSVVILEKGGNGNQVVSDLVEHGLIVRQCDLGVLLEDRLEFTKTLGGNVETDGVVDTAELLEESLADKANTDNTDKGIVAILGDFLISKGTRRLSVKLVE